VLYEEVSQPAAPIAPVAPVPKHEEPKATPVAEPKPEPKSKIELKPEAEAKPTPVKKPESPPAKGTVHCLMLHVVYSCSCLQAFYTPVFVVAIVQFPLGSALNVTLCVV